MKKFSDWLLKELKDRNMTQAQLASLAGLGTGTISNIVTGTRQVGQDTLVKIGKALQIPEEELFQAAGLFKPSPISKILTARFISVLDQLGEGDIDELYQIALIRLNRNKTKH